jgi:uncharacterized protein YuzE
MRADYDPSAETIQIELEPSERLDRDDVDIDGIVVGLHDGKPVLIDLIGTGPTVEARLRAVSGRHGLDAEALIAAANAALAAPGRTVTLDVATVPSL